MTSGRQAGLRFPEADGLPVTMEHIVLREHSHLVDECTESRGILL